jgi:hypothetical protein
MLVTFSLTEKFIKENKLVINEKVQLIFEKELEDFETIYFTQKNLIFDNVLIHLDLGKPDISYVGYFFEYPRLGYFPQSEKEYFEEFNFYLQTRHFDAWNYRVTIPELEDCLLKHMVNVLDDFNKNMRSVSKEIFMEILKCVYFYLDQRKRTPLTEPQITIGNKFLGIMSNNLDVLEYENIGIIWEIIVKLYSFGKSGSGDNNKHNVGNNIDSIIGSIFKILQEQGIDDFILLFEKITSIYLNNIQDHELKIDFMEVLLPRIMNLEVEQLNFNNIQAILTFFLRTTSTQNNVYEIYETFVSKIRKYLETKLKGNYQELKIQERDDLTQTKLMVLGFSKICSQHDETNRLLEILQNVPLDIVEHVPEDDRFQYYQEYQNMQQLNAYLKPNFKIGKFLFFKDKINRTSKEIAEVRIQNLINFCGRDSPLVVHPICFALPHHHVKDVTPSELKNTGMHFDDIDW